MKGLTLFESAVIGFFVGIIVSTYIAFIDSTGGYLGYILNFVSLRPALSLLTIPENRLLVVKFLFIVAVYVVYGLILGFILKKNGKAKFIVIPVILLLIAAIFMEQKSGAASQPAVPGTDYLGLATSSLAIRKTNQQYFGTEAAGDLNFDGKDDVAFIISRNDADRGILYYLTASLAVKNGHAGANLLFLGDKVEPNKISIGNGIINVAYADHSDNKTKNIYARMNGGNLELIDIKNGGDLLVQGEIAGGEGTLTFRPCGRDDELSIVNSSTTAKKLSAEVVKIASSSQVSLPIFGSLVGKMIDAEAASTSPKAGGKFMVTNIVNFVPKGKCP